MNYPYFSPQQQQRPNYVEQPQIGLRGRPVSSIEEVRATSIDFDGTVFFFPDLANKRIFTKQINMDGTSSLNVYELAATPEPQPSADLRNFVTRDELAKVINEFKESLKKPEANF